jgi:hypothetical protein
MAGLSISLLHAASEVGQDIANDHQAIIEAYEEETSTLR